MTTSYAAFVFLSIVVFTIVYRCAAFFRLQGILRVAFALAVAGVLFVYTTWQHHFPCLPDFVPQFDTLKLTELRYVDEYPIWGSYGIYIAEYKRQTSADEAAKEIEEKLRAVPAYESVSVKLDEYGTGKAWQITAHLPKRPRMPAGGGCEISLGTEVPSVRLVVFRARPWL